MDVVRGAAIVLVMFHHAVSSLDQRAISIPEPLDLADDALAPFRMPTLIFLSGMLLSKSIAKPTGEYLDGKVRKILWPYVVWSLIILSVAGEISGTALVDVIIEPPTGLWYLWFLMVFYVGALIINRLRIPWLLVAVGAIMLSAFAPDAYRAARFLYLLAFFAAGHLYMQHRAQIDRWLRRWLLVVIGGAAAVTVGVISATDKEVRYESIWAWGVFAAVAIVVRFAPAIPTSGRTLAPITSVGVNSLVYYVSHWPVMLLVMYAFDWLDITNPWVSVLANVLVAFAACVVLVTLNRRSRLVAAFYEFPRLRKPNPVSLRQERLDRGRFGGRQRGIEEQAVTE